MYTWRSKLGAWDLQVPLEGDWLAGDVDGDGLDEIVHLADAGGRLGMVVMGANDLQTMEIGFASPDMNNGPGREAWLLIDINGDGKKEIIQIWDNATRAALIVYGFDADGRISQRWGGTMADGSGAVAWLGGRFHSPDRQEIAQLWNADGHLAIIMYANEGEDPYELKLRTGMSEREGYGYGAIAYLVADVNGDGRDEIIQLWDNTGSLGLFVYGGVENGMEPAWASGNMGEGSGAAKWLVGRPYGGDRDSIIQVWNNSTDNAVGLIVYSGDDACAMRVHWGTGNAGHTPHAIDWFCADVNGDGKDEIIQVFDEDGRTYAMVYGNVSGTEIKPLWCNRWSNAASSMDREPTKHWFAGKFLKEQPAVLNQIIHPLVSGIYTDIEFRLHGMPGNRHITDAHRRAILEMYAPHVWMAPEEEYRPVPVEYIFQHTERVLIDGKYWLRTKEKIGSPSDELAYFRGQPGFGPVYSYWVDKGPYIDLVYFFNYAYNRGKNVADTVWGNHVGDWEYMIVRLHWVDTPPYTDLVPLKIHLSAHDGGSEHPWDAFEKVEGTHPVVYSARGSHATYLNEGNHTYKTIDIISAPDWLSLDFLEDVVSIKLIDVCGKGEAWRTWDWMELFHFNSEKNLVTGEAWPKWMYQDYGNPGDNPPNPASGPIYRWGNPADGKYADGIPARLEDGPTGPIEKPVWGLNQFG